ncbi:marvel domain-containing protein [Xylariales sp. PMI_506]|nr:marvel domain-containing protein [Xylariales sp. PMI_506]
MESRFITNILRLVQLLWTLLITALIGNAIASDDGAATSAKSALNFVMFVAVLSWVALLYGLLSSFVGALAIPIAMLALDGLATLFTFIAGIVLAAKLKAVNCSNLSGQPSDYIAFGSGNDAKQCHQIQASTAFLWFLFACFLGTFFFAFKAFRGVGGSTISRGPNMSQIGV